MFETDTKIICSFCFFFNDTATTEIYTLPLHDALPILDAERRDRARAKDYLCEPLLRPQKSEIKPRGRAAVSRRGSRRSEEHTSELQSRQYLVCRLLLEKKKKSQHLESIRE